VGGERKRREFKDSGVTKGIRNTGRGENKGKRKLGGNVVGDRGAKGIGSEDDKIGEQGKGWRVAI